MLHHQHPVNPIPRNQLRDNNNVTRMAQHPQKPMRLPQPGMQGGGPQRQPHPHNPHLMIQGMQPPQPNVPGAESEGSIIRMQAQMAPTAAPAVTPTSQSSTAPQAPMSPSNPQQQVGGIASGPITTVESVAATEEQQQQTSIILPQHLANTKEKTPMCLINELARFNKVTHQYRLTSETGPAHKKRFTVTLKLGDEEYTSEGPSIKKAQHSAAGDALTTTHYEHPPPKTQRVLRMRKVNITPTVELNALAMKRGEPTSYTFREPLPPPYPPNFNYRGMAYQVGEEGRKLPIYNPNMFFVSLRVGERDFSGQGRTAQSARHDAASKALIELRQLPLPEGVVLNGEENGEQVCKESIITVTTPQEPGSELKSPISVVHELALKRSLSVSFEVVREKGPPHMRTFLTNCRVGEIVTEGEGNSKKTSKKRAAESMLDELKKLPPISPPALIPQRLKRKPTVVKKKTRNLIKVCQEPKVKPELADDINPISRLIQIQQAKKEREPEYTLIEERGVPRRREFVMEVSIGQQSSTGSGPNKKLAKRAAAEALLQLLGYSSVPEGPVAANAKAAHTEKIIAGSALSSGTSEKTRKVTFQDDAVVESKEQLAGGGLQPGGSGGRQLVPGLLLMTDASAVQGFQPGGKGKQKQRGGVNGAASAGGATPTRQTAAVIAKELLNCGSSPTAEALVAAGHMQTNSVAANSNHAPTATAALVTASVISSVQTPRPKDLLNYLSNLLKFSVQYTDFPKVNQSEFLSLVSLSTTPPQVFHGAGPTTDASHDQAARTALQVLSELGLDTVNSSADTQPDALNNPAEGHHLIGGSKSAVTSNGK